MQPEFRVAGRIARPLAEIFKAVAGPARLSAYFILGDAALGDGRTPVAIEEAGWPPTEGGLSAA